MPKIKTASGTSYSYPTGANSDLANQIQLQNQENSNRLAALAAFNARKVDFSNKKSSYLYAIIM